MFKKSVRDAILSMGEYNRFTKGIFSFVGFKTYFMPYKAEARANGVSNWSFVSLFKYAISELLLVGGKLYAMVNAHHPFIPISQQFYISMKEFFGDVDILLERSQTLTIEDMKQKIGDIASYSARLMSLK